MAKQLLNVSVFGTMIGQSVDGSTITKQFNTSVKAIDWKGIRPVLESVCNDGDFDGGAVISWATFEAQWFDGRNYVTHFAELHPGKLTADLFFEEV